MYHSTMHAHTQLQTEFTLNGFYMYWLCSMESLLQWERFYIFIPFHSIYIQYLVGSDTFIQKVLHSHILLRIHIYMHACTHTRTSFIVYSLLAVRVWRRWRKRARETRMDSASLWTFESSEYTKTVHWKEKRLEQSPAAVVAAPASSPSSIQDLSSNFCVSEFLLKA